MSNPYFRFKQFTVWHDRCAMKVGTDGVLIGAWCDVAGCRRILDVGCGTGLIALMAAQRTAPEVQVDGVEIDAGQPDLALIDLEEAIRLDASQAEAYLMRGQLYLSQQKKKLAKEDLEKAVSLGIAPGDVRDLLQQCK